MSDYLIRQIGATPNIDVCYRVQVADGTGTGHLESLVLAGHRLRGAAQRPGRRPVRPHRLPAADAMARRERRTRPVGVHPHRPGPASRPRHRWPPGRPPLPLETSLPGVFAAGDVRHGSVKRVASAVGEGAATIPLVHRYLHTTAAGQPPRAGNPPAGQHTRDQDSVSGLVNVPTPTEHNVIAIRQVRRPEMEQIMTGVSAQKSSFHPRAAAATVADVMRPPLTTVNQHDHVAAAAYLMKHAGTTALMVVDAQTGQPAGIITEADVARAIADGKDVNDIWVDAVMTTRPAVITTTSIRDAAKIMTARHFRHLPVAGDAGLLGVVDIIDVCRALINAGQG